MVADKILEAMKRGLESGDSTALSKVMKYAVSAAEKDIFCFCTFPKIYSDDILCGECLLIHRGQVRLRPHYKEGWHTPWPDRTFKNLCHICCRHVDHPSHIRQQRSF